MVKDRKKLEMVTFYVWVLVYFPIALIVLSMFITVNLVLLPFAYLKTLVHKATLLKRYRAKTQCQSFFIFLAFGVPLLFIA